MPSSALLAWVLACAKRGSAPLSAETRNTLKKVQMDRAGVSAEPLMAPYLAVSRRGADLISAVEVDLR